MSQPINNTFCTPLAVDAAACLPASAVAQGGCTRNRDAWLSIADFLTLQNLRLVIARRLAAEAASDGKRSAAAAASAAGLSTVPHGNHGENNGSNASTRRLGASV